ncbi:MAG: hypothetical protein EXX96DRAFT_550900 [Benjaminiella poitrasii]|nr:MAG: hypothetical protein EXX96DRAFT_550900 [Benjaminiella poitrasii]
MKFYLLLSTLVIAVKAQVQSPTYLFNVTSPAVNSPYVASQILPCIYDVADNVTSDNLQLSILLVGSNSSTVMTASADISQGFSFQKQIGGATVYEHQYNYNIPSNTTAGNYQVVFADSVSHTNVSIPITISVAPHTPSSTPLASASSSSTSSSSTTLGSIFKDTNSASHPAQLSTFLLFVSFILAFIQFL